MTQYTNFRNKTCKKCWVYRFCDFCFYTLYASKERKGINKYCKIIKYDYAQVIKSYIKILKSNGSAFDIYKKNIKLFKKKKKKRRKSHGKTLKTRLK